MKKIGLLSMLMAFFFVGFAQNDYSHSVTLSPGSIFLGRINTKFEKLTGSNFSYGAKLEATYVSAFDNHIWLNPYGRFYFFSQEQNGLYSELGVFYRFKYANSFDYTEYDVAEYDYFKSAPGARFYLGAQWFTGKQSKIPFDIALGLNLDAQQFQNPSEIAPVTGLLGPLSLLSVRIQTGIAW